MKNYDDKKEDQHLQMLIGESNPPLWVNIENTDRKILSSKELVFPKASLGGIRRLHEIYLFDSKKYLVLSITSDILSPNLQLIYMDPFLRGWKEVTKDNGEMEELMIIFQRVRNYIYIICVF